MKRRLLLSLLLSATSLPALCVLQCAAADVAIRDQTPEEERLVRMSSHVLIGERARDCSAFVGRSLSQIGIAGELVVHRESCPGNGSSPRPKDSTVRSAITDFVLAVFPASWSSQKDYRSGRYVTGKLKDGRRFTILFVNGSPVAASVEINPDTMVEFQLKKKPDQTPEPTPQAITPSSAQKPRRQ